MRDDRLRPLEFQNVNPERGRKRDRPIDEHKFQALISEREPRKGTETSRPKPVNAIVSSTFQNVNPERGRKHNDLLRVIRLDHHFRT